MPAHSEGGGVASPQTIEQQHPRIRKEIAISGMSGRFPESGNIEEFWTNLISGIDMVTENEKRWLKGEFGLPGRIGVLKDDTKFDSSFFGIPRKQADLLSLESRFLLETTYECIIDAGVDPSQLRGKKIGVYVGVSRCESEIVIKSLKAVAISGYALLGTANAMFANRISFHFDFRGPSFVINTAYSSGTQALTLAIQDMLANKCEAAVVAAGNFCLLPYASVMYMNEGLLSPDGKCKAFDESANGVAPSESVVSLFLQRAEDAKRIYATVVNARTCNYGKESEENTAGVSEATQRALFEETYCKAGISPSDISYIEANGTGIKNQDIKEVNAIASVFCKDRQEPLLMGSVKSNMGLCEGPSGLVSIVKVLLAMHHGVIPPNLHYNKPDASMTSLINGRIQIPTKPTPWSGHLAAINCYGQAGVNSHVILRANKIKTFNESPTLIPRLMACCGRTREGLEHFLNQLETGKTTPEELALLNEVNKIPTSYFEHRGFLLKEQDGTTTAKEINRAPYHKAPIWYIFTGMGSQWSKMGKDLMELPLFNSTTERLAGVLKRFGINLIHMLNDAADEEIGTTLASFVSITAVQVALVNVLNTLGVSPDGIIGHSIGEVACAYADGCLTEEQAMTIAYWRGKCIDDAKLPKGGMAAIGLSVRETEARLPKGLVVACHNAKDSVTISGLEDQVVKFADDMKSEGIFARYVNTCGVPFHSPFMEDAGQLLKDALKHVIPDPKPRSSRWLSTSIPSSEWNTPLAQYASRDYFVNNLLAPVFFEEAVRNIPQKAIVVEIAPHGLLQPILKRSLPSGSSTIGLTNKRHRNNLEHFLMALGKLFTMGVNISFNPLYPSVPYPVSNDAKFLSTIIKWNHAEDYHVCKWGDYATTQSSAVTVDLSNPEKETSFLAGHCIDGKVLYPATGYLCLAWKAFSEAADHAFATLPIAFEDCTFHRATILPKSGEVRLTVDVHPASGKFEISESSSTACSGRIYIPDKNKLKKMATLEDLPNKRQTSTVLLDQKDIYNILRLRGYDYKGDFQSLMEADTTGMYGALKWNGNFVTFLDGLMQLAILGQEHEVLCVPTRLGSLIIDVTKINTEYQDYFGQVKPVARERSTNIFVTTGIEMKGLRASPIPRKETRQYLILESYFFVKNWENNVLRGKEKEELREYTVTSSSLCNKILEMVQDEAACKNRDESTNIVTDDVKNVIETKDKKQILLQTLTEIYSLKPTSFADNELQSIVSHYYNNRKDDYLYQFLLGERTLRVALDLVVENLFSRQMKMVEFVHDQSTVIANEVLAMLENSSVAITPTYTIAAKDTSLLKDNAWSSKAITVAQINASEDLPTNLKASDLIIFHDPFEKFDVVEIFGHASDVLKESGFLLLVMRTSFIAAEKLVRKVKKATTQVPMHEDIQKYGEEKGFVTISVRGDSEFGGCVMLFRKSPKVIPSVKAVIHVTEGCYSWVEELKKECRENSEACRIWLVGNHGNTNGIIGFVNCLKQELGGENIRCIFQYNGEANSLPPVNFESDKYKDILRKDLVMNVFKDGVAGSFRHQYLPSELQLKPQENAYLNVMVRGDLSSLRWFSSPMRLWPKNARLCDVYYASLNFRDIMLASGKLPVDALPVSQHAKECSLGFEYVGRDRVTGKRIMGLASSETFATTVQIDERLVWDVPDDWTMEDACTVPATYATAYYAMIMRGKMKRGSSILIHSGSGGVGQAAIAIALSMHCEIFITVGSEEKKEFLKKRFPQLKESNFFSSRDTMFEIGIKNATKGRGVDMVLNSLAEEKLQASVRCIAEFGVFLELGKYDLSQDNKLGLEAFTKNMQFHGVLLDMFLDDSRYSRAQIPKLSALLLEGIKTGVVKPLSRKIFDACQAEEGFRYMASGKHIGKVALKIRDEEAAKVAFAKPVTMPAIVRSICDPSKTYVITGGLGGFGFELAKWLVFRGAKTLLLTSRSGIKTGYQKRCFEQWKKKGINVLVANLNVSKLEEAVSLLRSAMQCGRIGGIFHLAMVLEDAMFENQTAGRFKTVCEPKVDGTHNLDKASRSICPDVEWFVVFSSISSGRGNAGQSNYGFANSVMERICERRREDGLSGLAIQWGAVGDVGVLHDNMGGNDVTIAGVVPQRISSCLATLDRFLQENHAVLSSFVKINSNRDVCHCSPLEAAARILGFKDIDTVPEEAPLSSLGLDSLMAVEVKQSLERDFNIVLSMQDIRNLTLSKLKEINKAYISNKQQSDQASSKKTESSDTFIPSSSSYFTVPTDLSVPLNSVTDGVPLFIIHPIEGTVDSLKVLGSLLPFPVIGIQNTREAAKCDSIEELSQMYFEVIENRCPGGPYNIAGYSFGTIPAFEIALHLQEKAKGKKMPQINLIMIDGSPLIASYEAKAQQEHFKMEERHIEAKIITGFAKLQRLTLNFSQFTDELASLPHSEARLTYLADMVLTKLPQTATREEFTETAKAFLKRAKLTHTYLPNGKFSGDATLIKASQEFMSLSEIPKDYGLSQVIHGKVIVHEIEGDHTSIISGNNVKEVAEILKKIIK